MKSTYFPLKSPSLPPSRRLCFFPFRASLTKEPFIVEDSPEQVRLLSLSDVLFPLLEKERFFRRIQTPQDLQGPHRERPDGISGWVFGVGCLCSFFAVAIYLPFSEGASKRHPLPPDGASQLTWNKPCLSLCTMPAARSPFPPLFDVIRPHPPLRFADEAFPPFSTARLNGGSSLLSRDGSQYNGTGTAFCTQVRLILPIPRTGAARPWHVIAPAAWTTSLL